MSTDMRILTFTFLLSLLTSPVFGKSVLFIMSGSDYILGVDGKKYETGYWLEEFSTPYQVLKQEELQIDVATPKGNRPKADPSSLLAKRWSSQNEYKLAIKLKKEVLDEGKILDLSKLSNRVLKKYDALFFPGGHAPMEDLYQNKSVARALRLFHKNNRPTALVCHGPIALLSTFTTNGPFPYKGYKVTSFSNTEEAASHLGKLLKITPEDALKQAGLSYSKGENWKPYIVEDRELLTGQNPASSKMLAEALLQRLK